MTTYDILPYIPIAVFLGFMIWDTSKNNFLEAIEVSRHQLEISKELLEETRALRKAIEDQKRA